MVAASSRDIIITNLWSGLYICLCMHQFGYSYVLLESIYTILLNKLLNDEITTQVTSQVTGLSLVDHWVMWADACEHDICIHRHMYIAILHGCKLLILRT